MSVQMYADDTPLNIGTGISFTRPIDSATTTELQIESCLSEQ